MAALNVAMIGWWAQPLGIDALTRGLGLETARAASVVAAELFTLTLASLTVSLFVSRMPLRGMALLGTLLVSALHFAAMSVGDFERLLVLRALAGLCEGVVLAAANASIASVPNPGRAYALQNLSNVVYCGLFMAVLPLATEQGGAKGLYAATSVASVLLLPGILLLPARAAPVERPTVAGARGQGPLLLLGMLLWATAAGVPWAFLAELGEPTHLTLHQIGLVASLTGAGGVAGGLLAGRWAKAELAGVACGMVLMCVMTAVLVRLHEPVFYVAAAVTYVGGLYFVLPFLFGLAARIDPRGGLPAAMGATFVLSGSTSVMSGGALIQAWGSVSMLWFLVAACVCSAALLWWLSRRIGADLCTAAADRPVPSI